MAPMKTEFETRLENLLNSFSVENESDTPDFILAAYLVDCLETWNKTIKSRDKWYGHKTLSNREEIANG